MEPSGINSKKPLVPNIQPSPAEGGGSTRTPPKSGEEADAARASGKRGEEQQGKRPKAGSVDQNSLKEVQKRINEALDKLRFSLNFSIDREVDELVVKVVDPDTKEVVREIPPEEMRELAKRMEEVTGILLDERR